MATVLTSPRYCHSLLNPIKRCLPVLANTVVAPCGGTVDIHRGTRKQQHWDQSNGGNTNKQKLDPFFFGKFDQSRWENPSKTMTRNCMILPEMAWFRMRWHDFAWWENPAGAKKHQQRGQDIERMPAKIRQAHMHKENHCSKAENRNCSTLDIPET